MPDAPRRTSLDSFLPQFAPPGEPAHAAPLALNGHGHLNGHAANGHDLLNGHDTLNGHDALNGQSSEEEVAEDEAVYLDDDLPITFDDLEASAVDTLHASPEFGAGLSQADSVADDVALGGLNRQPAPVLPPEAAKPQAAEATPVIEVAVPVASVVQPVQITAPAKPEPLEHPAAGSLFMPYLVTEISHLRNRVKQRSWWRRLFG